MPKIDLVQLSKQLNIPKKQIFTIYKQNILDKDFKNLIEKNKNLKKQQNFI